MRIRIWPFFIIAFGVVLLYWSSIEIYHETLLQKDPEAILAPVDEFYTTDLSADEKEYSLQYHFTVNGETYSAQDATGRKNLIYTIPQEDWEEAQLYGDLPVYYLKSNPWVNRPIVTVYNPMSDHIGGFVLGVFLSLGLILGMIVEKSRIKRHLPSLFIRKNNPLGVKYMFWKE